MKKVLKVIAIIGLAIISIALLGFIMRSCGLMKDPNAKKEIVIVKKFSELTPAQQEDSIYGFTVGKNYTDTRYALNERIRKLITEKVKYSETLEFLYNDEWVDGKNTYIFNSSDFSVDPKFPNRITVIVNFRSENGFSQKVRNKFFMTFDFNGNEVYKLIDANFIQ